MGINLTIQFGIEYKHCDSPTKANAAGVKFKPKRGEGDMENETDVENRHGVQNVSAIGFGHRYRSSISASRMPIFGGLTKANAVGAILKSKGGAETESNFDMQTHMRYRISDLVVSLDILSIVIITTAYPKSKHYGA
jgi:hypothetical protein